MDKKVEKIIGPSFFRPTVKLSIYKTTSDMFRTIWAFKTRELIMNNWFAIQRYRALNIIILFYLSKSVNNKYLCIFYLKFVIYEKIGSIYLNFSLNFHLKNVYFYPGTMPISKAITLWAFVSICVCNAQSKLEIPIVLHGTWSVGTLIRRNLHHWLTWFIELKISQER